jgi:alpha-1,2-mannosyltransferase
VAAWLLAGPLVAIVIWRNVSGQMIDLDTYRAGALSILHGTHLYEIRGADKLLFTYPPVAAILAIPLVAVPFSVAKIVWVAMIYGPLAVAVWYGFRALLTRAGDYAPAVFAVLFGVTAVLSPLRQEVYFGQIDMFLVALCLIDCAAERPRWPRGLLVGLATAIKLVPGVFIIYLLVTGRRQAAAVAGLSFAGLTLLALAVAPADSRAYWTSAIFQTRRLGDSAAASNQALRGMLMRAFLPGQSPVALWLAVAAVVAIAGFAAARLCWQRGNDMAGIAITGLLSAELSPVAWIHHLCWIVVAIGVVTGACRSWRRVCVAGLTVCLFLLSVPIWSQDVLIPHGLAILPGRVLEDSFGLAALALIAVMALMSARSPAVGAPSAAGPDSDVSQGQVQLAKLADEAGVPE